MMNLDLQREALIPLWPPRGRRGLWETGTKSQRTWAAVERDPRASQKHKRLCSLPGSHLHLVSSRGERLRRCQGREQTTERRWPPSRCSPRGTVIGPPVLSTANATLWRGDEDAQVGGSGKKQPVAGPGGRRYATRHGGGGGRVTASRCIRVPSSPPDAPGRERLVGRPTVLCGGLVLAEGRRFATRALAHERTSRGPPSPPR